MKRTLLAFAVFVISCSSVFGQLYDQMAPSDVTGYWSNSNSEISAGLLIQCADDFEVTGPAWSVESIAVRGFRGDDALFSSHSMDSMAIVLYADDAGVPGTMIYGDTVYILPMIEPAPTTKTSFNLVLGDSLYPGTYWLSVYGFGASNTSVWRWIGIDPDEPVNGNQAVLKDELNILGGGATDWTPLTDIPGSPPPETLDLTFEVNGFIGTHEKVGLDELSAVHIDLYPNPASQSVFIKSELPIQQLTIYDLSGNEVKNDLFPGNQVDVSTLPRGLYILQFLTERGYSQEKLMVD